MGIISLYFGFLLGNLMERIINWKQQQRQVSKFYHMSFSSAAYREVDTIVSSWTEKYRYHISLMESKSDMAKLMVQFSLTKPEKPVPIGTVRVYFTCVLDDHIVITFRFEKDSLIHSIDKTIRHNQIQKWIDDALEKKLLVRKTVFYLGTSYEETRVQDQRLDQLLYKPPVQKKDQVCYIDPELLSDQARSIEIMEQPHKNLQALQKNLLMFFRQVDSENIGVITRPEFLQIVKNIGLKLNEVEEKEVLNRVDQENTGTVEFIKYKQIMGEVLEAQEAREQADLNLNILKQQELFTTILSFINDDVQNIENDILVHFKVKEDEEDDGLTNISQVKTMLEKINKKFKDDSKPEPLTPIEMAEITKILTDEYGYKSIPYRSIHGHIIEYKIKTFSTGLINSKMCKLEVFVREICDKFDQKKFGRIKISDLVIALEKCEQIKLTKAQIYLLESILPSDTKGQISYIECSKFLAEVIKKFYLYSSKKQQ